MQSVSLAPQGRWTALENTILIGIKQDHLLHCGPFQTWSGTYRLYKKAASEIGIKVHCTVEDLEEHYAKLYDGDFLDRAKMCMVEWEDLKVKHGLLDIASDCSCLQNSCL